MKKTVLFLLLLALAALPAAADTPSPLTFDIGLRLLGADVGLGYRGLSLLPGTQTTLWAYAGGGYEWMSYYRDASGALLPAGALAAGGALDGRDPGFERTEGAWRLGIDQGLAWNERTGRNLASVFFFYRGRYSANSFTAAQLLADVSLPDRDALFLNVLQLGVTWDDLLFHAGHKTKDGVSAEASAEWAPSFLLNNVVGDASYVRFNVNARGFLPLWDLDPSSPMNTLSLYAGDYASVDYALGLGAPVPIYIRQSFGGRDQNTGLGSSVRGVDTASLDTAFKAVNNLELRLNLPALFVKDLVPGLVVFWDAGYYAQVGEGLAAPVPAGFVTSVGAGLYIDLLDLASLAAYVDWRLDGVNANGSPLRLGAIEFGMHF
jgi:hypothetical protein